MKILIVSLILWELTRLAFRVSLYYWRVRSNNKKVNLRMRKIYRFLFIYYTYLGAICDLLHLKPLRGYFDAIAEGYSALERMTVQMNHLLSHRAR